MPGPTLTSSLYTLYPIGDPRWPTVGAGPAGGFAPGAFSHVPVIVEPDQSQFFGLTATFDSGAGQPFSQDNIREYTVKYKIATRNKAYANNICMVKALGLPGPYWPYVSTDGLVVDPCAFAVRIRADPLDPEDWQWWVITVDYSTQLPEEGANFYTQWPSSVVGPQNNPWQKRARLRMEFEDTTEAFPFDLNGKAYTSSAGQPFTPPPTRTHKHVVLVFTRNMPTNMVTPQTVSDFNNCTNDQTFLGQPVNCVFCNFLPGDLKYLGRIPYYEVTIRFKLETRTYLDPNTIRPGFAGVLKRRTWQPLLLDQGTEQKVTHPLFRLAFNNVPIIRHGQPTTQPQLLDGFGAELRPAADGKLYPRYVEFEDFPKRNLQTLFNNM